MIEYLETRHCFGGSIAQETIRKNDKEFILGSGMVCKLIQIKRDLIPNYYLLAFPKAQGEPKPEDITEMLILGTTQAQSLAMGHLNLFAGSPLSRENVLLDFSTEDSTWRTDTPLVKGDHTKTESSHAEQLQSLFNYIMIDAIIHFVLLE